MYIWMVQAPLPDFTRGSLIHDSVSSRHLYSHFALYIRFTVYLPRKMFSIIWPFLQCLPLKAKLYLNAVRNAILRTWYTKVPTPAARHLCQLCRDTMQKKSGGTHDIPFFQSDLEMTGQHQFETYALVNCPHHLSVQSSEASAGENCMICSRVWLSLGSDMRQRELLLEGIDPNVTPFTYCYIAEGSQVDNTLPTNCILVSIGVPERSLPAAPNPETFILLPSRAVLPYTHWGLPSNSTNSAQSRYYAKFWYQNCIANHAQCNRKRLERGGQWYPTRLLKLSRWTNKAQLVITAEERPNTPYVTLSHCWGKADFIQLTRSTFEEFRKDIPYGQLSKTFQDAVSVARNFGIYYIWIDSLCIIQQEESLEDWKLEAPKMDKIYSNAILNISATGAQDSSKGLFFPRQADSMLLPEIRLDWQHTFKISIRFTILDYDYWKNLAISQPLIRRAWVVQERLLARRVLHFGSNQLFWECAEQDASEHFPMGMPPPLLLSGSLFKSFDRIVELDVDQEHPSPAHAVWQRALRSFTKAQLTKSEDKLIALGGIASELGSKFSYNYIAGLWKDYMATELLWYVDNDTFAQRYKEYRAPSFSWASINGAVIPGEWQTNNILIEVTGADVMTETSNPFGSVKYGSVTLQGTVKQAWLLPNLLHTQEHYVPRNARSRLPIRQDYGHIGTLHADSMASNQRWVVVLNNVFAPANIEPKWNTYGRAVYSDEQELPEIAEEFWPMLGAKVYLDQEPPPDIVIPRHVYCMVVAGSTYFSCVVRGLILESVEGVEGLYRRLGVFVTNHGRTINVLGVPHRSEPDISCKEYDTEAHKHTIVII